MSIIGIIAGDEGAASGLGVGIGTVGGVEVGVVVVGGVSVCAGVGGLACGWTQAEILRRKKSKMRKTLRFIPSLKVHAKPPILYWSS